MKKVFLQRKDSVLLPNKQIRQQKTLVRQQKTPAKKSATHQEPRFE
ncbi:MAG: hypothetical protein LBT35_03020 [Tannerella sp.]|jgi:hypothetical protein|nr:hypothetical protein [Tannerella sp.]